MLKGKRPNAKTVYLTETVLCNTITRNIIVLSFKDSLRKPLGRRPRVANNSDILGPLAQY